MVGHQLCCFANYFSQVIYPISLRNFQCPMRNLESHGTLSLHFCPYKYYPLCHTSCELCVIYTNGGMFDEIPLGLIPSLSDPGL